MNSLKNPVSLGACRVIAIESQFSKPWDVRLNCPEQPVPSDHQREHLRKKVRAHEAKTTSGFLISSVTYCQGSSLTDVLV